MLKKYYLFAFSLLILGFVIFYIWADIARFPRETIYYDPNSHAWEIIQDGRISNYVGNFSAFFYFTIQGGIIFSLTIVFYYLPIKIKERKTLVSPEFALAIVIYELAIFVIFWSSIAPWIDWIQIPKTLAIEVTMHAILPFFAVLFFYFNRYELLPRPKEFKLFKKTMKLTPFLNGLRVLLIYPIFYYAFALIFYLSIQGNAAIYPFLNFRYPFSLKVSIFVAILLNFVIFATCVLVFVGSYFLAYWLVKKINSKKMIKNKF